MREDPISYVYPVEQKEEERIRRCVQELSTQKAAIVHTTVAGEENEVYSTLKEKVDRETEVSGGLGGKEVKG